MDDNRGLAAALPTDEPGTSVAAAAEQESSARAEVVPPETLPESLPPPKDRETGPLPRLTTFPTE